MRRQRWYAYGAATILSAAIVTGCTSGSEDKTSERACGILDASLIKEATGTAKFSNAFDRETSDSDLGTGLLAVGQADDGSPRKKFECTVTDSTNHVFLQISGRSNVSDADRTETLATFTQAAAEPGCDERTESPVGSVCTDGAETTVRLMFDDRWVRVRAEAKQGVPGDADATISPDLAVEIAENVNTNLK